MEHDNRDILEVFKEELAFIEQGGYGRSVKTPWKATSVFQDSLSCLNYGYPYKAHPCSECMLTAFVPPEAQATPLPCHHIPLTEAGETINELELEDNQQRLEESIKDWLRARIREIEEQRAMATVTT
jgi:hypothetical protein